MKILLFIALVIGVLVLSGCIEPQADKIAGLGEHFTLTKNQTASINQEGILIRFEGISADSRCPQGAQCIWAGQVVAGFETKKDDRTSLFNLTLGSAPENASEFLFEGYRIKLLEVQPYPKLNESKKDYAVTIVVSKG